MNKLFIVTVAAMLLPGAPILAQADLGVASYSEKQELRYPDNLDEWVLMGSSLGSDYSDRPFDPEDPGTIGTVQMEPAAYRYFKEHGQYADGTMFLLSFYESETQSRPHLNGFVQGKLRAQEIHVIDKQRFKEGSAFFVYQTREQKISERMPDNSACIRCHVPEGDYNSTFIQFYPVIRDLPRH